MKNKEILRWLAANWRTLESQACRPRRRLVVDDDVDLRQVNAEVLSRFVGQPTSKAEFPFPCHPWPMMAKE